MPVGPARLGDPRGQQRARHRHRPARGQTHARGEARPRPRARLLYAAMVVLAFAAPAATWAFGGLSAWLLLTLRGAPARAAADRDGLHAHRRAGAERRAGGHRPAAGGLLAAAVRRRAAVVKRTPAAALDPVPGAVRDGERRSERARARGAAAGGRATGRSATARPRRSSPTTACRSSARSRRSAAAAGGGPPQARAAEEIARLDLEARQEGRPLAEPARDALPVNLTLPAGPPEEVAERAARGRARGLRVLQGEGRPARGRRARGGGARGGRLLARAAGGRQPRLVGRRGGHADPRAGALRPRVRGAALPQRSRSCARCAGACPRRSPRTSRSARRARCGARSSWRPATSVNVKLAGAGGFRAAREALRLARSKGLGAFLSSTLDGPWGIAAALQLAASEDLQLACGLATLELFDSPLAPRSAGAAQRDAGGAGGTRAGRGGARRSCSRRLASKRRAKAAISEATSSGLLEVGGVARVRDDPSLPVRRGLRDLAPRRSRSPRRGRRR